MQITNLLRFYDILVEIVGNPSQTYFLSLFQNKLVI